jgi:hypothetical protein
MREGRYRRMKVGVKSKSDNIVRTFVNATMYPEHNNNTVSR